MATTGQNDTVEREVRIAARPETIFPFFTDPAKMVRWKGVHATLDPRPGGIYRVDVTGRNVAKGEYVEVNDLQAYLDKAEKLGGKTIMPPTEIPDQVTLAMFTDPEGNVIGLVKSEHQ